MSLLITPSTKEMHGVTMNINNASNSVLVENIHNNNTK
jgi:hypothetical protein